MNTPEPDDVVVPKSVAVIMDGNGRWAKRAGFERIRGHEKGIEAVRTTVTESARLGVEALVLYAFSEENWSRPKREIEMLFKLIAMGFVFHRNAYLRSAWCAATLPRASWVRGLGRFTKWEAVCGRVRACACVRACARMG